MKRKNICLIPARGESKRIKNKNIKKFLGKPFLERVIETAKKSKIFDKIAKNKSIQFVYGKENDVLSRLILCGKKTKATDILRITSESPFPYFQLINKFWSEHLNNSADATFLDNIIDGCGFEILSMNALIKSHKKGKKNHLEHCSLYIRENFKKFKVLKFLSPKKFNRKDIRLTVDYPEDLAVCRKIYSKLKKQAPLFKLESIVNFLDNNLELKKMFKPYLKDGYSSMYKWGK
jgi:spore coat polysaccharide biosynthesis protein SpsF